MPEEHSNWYYARNVAIGYALFLFWVFFPSLLDGWFQIESIFLSALAMIVGGIPIVWFASKYATVERDTDRKLSIRRQILDFIVFMLMASAIADLAFESTANGETFFTVVLLIYVLFAPDNDGNARGGSLRKN